MTRRDLLARLTGGVSLGASWGVCLWLRALMTDGPDEPGLLQAALVLASFVLTLVGLVLLLGGEKVVKSPGPASNVRFDGEPDPLARLSLADERAARADLLTRRVLRYRAKARRR